MQGNIVTEHTNGRTLANLVDALVAGKVDVLVDIRLSTKFPMDGRFFPEKLQAEVESKDIEYERMQALGNPYKEMEDVALMESNYRKYATTTKEFSRLFARTRVEKKTFCLLCYCKPPKPCHRYWLRDILLKAKDL